MAAGKPRRHHSLRAMTSDEPGRHQPRLVIVLEATIAHIEMGNDRRPHYLSRLQDLLSTQFRSAAGTHFALSQNHQPDPVASLAKLDNQTAASNLDIIRMRPESQ